MNEDGLLNPPGGGRHGCHPNDMTLQLVQTKLPFDKPMRVAISPSVGTSTWVPSQHIEKPHRSTRNGALHIATVYKMYQMYLNVQQTMLIAQTIWYHRTIDNRYASRRPYPNDSLPITTYVYYLVYPSIMRFLFGLRATPRDWSTGKGQMKAMVHSMHVEHGIQPRWSGWLRGGFTLAICQGCQWMWNNAAN